MTAVAVDAVPPSPPRPRLLIPYTVLAVSLLITFAAAAYVAMSATAKDRARFENAAERTQSAIQGRIDTYTNLLRGGAGLFSSQPYVTRKQFHAYVSRLELEQRYPGIQGFGVTMRIPPGRNDEIVKRMRNEGWPTFNIFPPGPREEYHAILYLEPPDRRNAAAVGYDMFTDPTRRAAMEMARDTGAPATSGKVILKQELDADVQAGFLIYVPLYLSGFVPAPLEMRRSALGGFVYAPFRADDLLAGIFGPQRYRSGVMLEVYDGTEVREAALLHRSDAPPATGSRNTPRFVKQVPLDVPGRKWTIVYTSGPLFEQNSSRGYTLMVLAAGAIVSVLLFALTAAQAAAAQRAQHAADELRKSESKFRRLADANLIGVAFSSLDGRIYDANDELCRILGRPRSEILEGRVRWDALTPSQWSSVDADAIAQIKSSGACAPYEKEFRRPDGSTVPALVGLAALEGSANDCVGLVVDLTTRKAAERELVRAKETAEAAQAHAEQASRLKDEFLATVSHELRTPLNAILGWAQLLRGGRSPQEDLVHGLETIERSAKAQAQLIDDLLDVSRIVAGKLRLDVQLVQPAAVVEAALASVRPAADAKGIRVVHVLDAHAGPVHADPNRLQQIAWNLLSNAVKFTPRGGLVQVVLRRTDALMQLIVSDTGIGISADFLPHVFERFRQADSSTTRRFGGLGIGLGIARHLTELHGGTVACESDGEGKGATFTLALPLAVAPPFLSDARPAPARGTAGEPNAHSDRKGQDGGRGASNGQALANVSVLLVEDDADARDLIVRVLREHGADVTAAASAADALVVFHALQPDILISDIGMPDEDGYSLIEQIRALPPERGGRIAAVALTALARPEDRHRAILAGFQVHIAKPVEPTALVEVVAHLAVRQQDRSP